MKKILLAVLVVCGSAASYAQFEVREFSLNGGGYTDNIKVVPMDNQLELSKFKFAFNPDTIALDRQYSAARHVVDRLSISDQTKILMFIHDATIEQRLAPSGVPSGEVTLLNIVKKSSHDTAHVLNAEDHNAYVRHAYLQKLNSFVPVIISEKRGQFLDFTMQNKTQFHVKRIYGNIRIVDKTNGRVIHDEMVKLPAALTAMDSRMLTLNMPSRLKDWKGLAENLAYKFAVTKVEFYDSEPFDADEFYKTITSDRQYFDPYPFTQIPKL
jgi:hypothetical protein